ncbi:hypothetical protein TRFO_16690 [Tritrichomonas foetus]|uniref:Uncharacterized protein n=1 Tax=Tritrichomonas foetus TaxID=1144522 RepID=A0A1J4KU00_9EUKA|nr:hypothetical protein TRFO_16690 [Tritrichomonas foetus]|eukprot:OHT13244.1 hypothetical protein TRFO_16690 [Tritrichomonas foetus]
MNEHFRLRERSPFLDKQNISSSLHLLHEADLNNDEGITEFMNSIFDLQLAHSDLIDEINIFLEFVKNGRVQIQFISMKFYEGIIDLFSQRSTTKCIKTSILNIVMKLFEICPDLIDIFADKFFFRDVFNEMNSRNSCSLKKCLEVINNFLLKSFSAYIFFNTHKLLETVLNNIITIDNSYFASLENPNRNNNNDSHQNVKNSKNEEEEEEDIYADDDYGIDGDDDDDSCRLIDVLYASFHACIESPFALLTAELASFSVNFCLDRILKYVNCQCLDRINLEIFIILGELIIFLEPVEFNEKILATNLLVSIMTLIDVNNIEKSACVLLLLCNATYKSDLACLQLINSHGNPIKILSDCMTNITFNEKCSKSVLKIINNIITYCLYNRDLHGFIEECIGIISFKSMISFILKNGCSKLKEEIFLLISQLLFYSTSENMLKFVSEIMIYDELIPMIEMGDCDGAKGALIISKKLIELIDNSPESFHQYEPLADFFDVILSEEMCDSLNTFLSHTITQEELNECAQNILNWIHKKMGNEGN